MKIILFFCALSLPLALHAQFVVGSEGMTIQSGAVLTIDSMVLQPSADFTIASNQFQHSSASYGNSIKRIYTLASPVNLPGTLAFFMKMQT